MRLHCILTMYVIYPMYYHYFSVVNWFVYLCHGTLYIEEPNTLVRVILILVIL
jgi:hypothetical protein